jgi:alpha-glucosidase (family GH31 glycosyl hydrolase)
MNFKLYQFFSCLSIFIALSVATTLAQTPVGNYQSGFERQGNEISFSTTNADVRLNFCTPSMFRVQVSWTHSFHNNGSLMVTRYQWPKMKFKAVNKGDHFLLQTKKLKVLINKSPFRIRIETLKGKVISSEADTNVNGGAYTNGDQVWDEKILKPGEQFFGFGERMGFVDQRGKKVHLWVGRGEASTHTMGAFNVMKANYSPIPFFMSTRGYGIFFHNSYATDWDMGHSNPNSYTFKAAGGELDYYFIYGPGFPAILDQYTDLTGKTPMMPRFAYGLQVGTYSGGTWGHVEDVSPQYVINLARKFRQLDIPADLLWLDSTWRLFGSLGHGGTTFQWRSVFKHPKAMLDSIYAMHYHMVGVHIRPFLDNGTKFHLLKKAKEHGGVLFPAPGRLGDIVNFFDSSAVDWWWKHGVMKVASDGVKFLKTDAGNSFRYYSKHKNGALAQTVDSLHNLFPLVYTRAPFEKFMKYNNMRGMTQTREGYAGIQRYPYIFSGDWPSRWQYYKANIKGALNIGLSGVSDWAHCMGGFGRKSGSELYIRWTQFGLLSPVAMLFGTDHPGYHLPWNYDQAALKNFRKYDKLRYQLMPYIYTTAYENHVNGLPMMRALVLEYQHDVNTYHLSDEYLFGNYMLICPVTTKGAQSRVIYLPKGTWYNYWTGEKVKGKQHITVPTPLLQMPIFIKAGAIIPMQQPMKYIGQEPVDTLRLDIYPGGNSSYSIYNDDGTSMAYKKGVYAITKIQCYQNNDGTKIEINTPKGKYDVPTRSYKLTIHTFHAPVSVSSNGKKLAEASSMNEYKKSVHTREWYFDHNQNMLYIRPGGNSRKSITIEINKK